jgi:hypothetical protein
MEDELLLSKIADTLNTEDYLGGRVYSKAPRNPQKHATSHRTFNANFEASADLGHVRDHKRH